RTILLHQAVSVNESYLWLADVATGVKTLLTTPGTDTVAYAGGGAQFSRDGKGIYLTTDQGSEVRRLAYLELLGKRYRFLSDRLPWDVDEFALSPDGRWIAVVTNEDGVGLIFPNVRGSTGHGKTFAKLDNGTLRDGAYRDIGALLDWIRTRPDLDPDHVLVTGGSYGGHMTLVTATLYNDRICCAVDVV